ncbi:hypothetical protein G6F24_014401 [Rhizopus arrhizus]|nr:hypothetical protein G6F24_014401 [Rhizopus arrhizus]
MAALLASLHADDGSVAVDGFHAGGGDHGTRADIARGRQPTGVDLSVDCIRQAIAGRTELERVVPASIHLLVGQSTGGGVVGRPAAGGIIGTAARIALDRCSASVAGMFGEAAEETVLEVCSAAAVDPLRRGGVLGEGREAKQAQRSCGERFKSFQHDYRPRNWRSARIMRAGRV